MATTITGNAYSGSVGALDELFTFSAEKQDLKISNNGSALLELSIDGNIIPIEAGKFYSHDGYITTIRLRSKGGTGYYNLTCADSIKVTTSALQTETSSLQADNTNLADNKYKLKLSAIMNTTIDMRLQRKEWYPTLFGVKTTNVRVGADLQYVTPRTIGWLYYDVNNPTSLLYSNGKPDNLATLCAWNITITFENKTQMYYSPFLTRQGDIICVFRGELESTALRGRQNPIVYPYGDLTNPVVVDLSSKACKPTSWLQNSGADYVYNVSKNYFMFAEYTRPIHTTANIWKVVPPFTDPANWTIVKTLNTSGSNEFGLEHFHSIQYDPFSGCVYACTGDDDANSKIYVSADDGATWTIVSEGNTESRLLNMVFTKDYMYYASDDPTRHVLIRVGRTNHTLDFVNKRTKLCDLPLDQATYTTCYLRDPSGLLMLDRHDLATSDPLKVCFWSFEDNKLYTIAELTTIDTQKAWGFRCEAVNWYQPTNDNRIVCGFGYTPNYIDVLDNVDVAGDAIYNLALEVVRNVSI